MNEEFNFTEDLFKKIKNQIRKNASPRHVPSKIIVVKDIPRTKSGKIVELAVKNVIEGNIIKNKEALANPQAAIKGGANIESQAKNKAEDQGKCVQGFIVGGPNNGEECS